MVRPILLRKHRFYSFSRFSFSLKFKTNVPVKLKLQQNSPLGIPRALFDFDSCPGREEFERCLERVENSNQIYLLF